MKVDPSNPALARSEGSAAGAGRSAKGAWILPALATALAIALALPAVVLAQGLALQRAGIERVYPDVRWVDTAVLARWVAGPAGQRPVLLDARDPAEFEVSHLAGARRVDPDATSFEHLRIPRGARVVVYCSVGWRSGTIADRLRLAGHEDVYNLEGGLFKWANEGRDLRRRGALGAGEARAERVHPYDTVWGRMLDADRRAPLP